MDITEVILSDHHEQRRMFAMLDEVDRSDTETLGILWTRLAAMLEVHAQAEELFFYPELLELGRRLHDSAEAEETKEEHEGLADFRRHVDLETRHRIAVTFAAYEARHVTGVPIVDKDPEQCVRDRS
jgi:hypothetical protein